MTEQVAEPIQENNKPKEKTPDSERVKEIRFNISSGETWLKNGNYGNNIRQEMWKRNKAYLRCDWKTAQVKKNEAERTNFNVNIPFANYHTVKPNLIFKNPYINVTSKKPEFVRDELGALKKDNKGNPVFKSDNYLNARLMQVRINHEIKQIKLKDVVERCVGHSIGHYGIGWAKVGYQENTVSEFNNDRNQKKNYWVEWCDPRDIVFDWKAVEAKKLRYIAQRFALPRSDLEAAEFKIPEGYHGELPEHLKDREQLSEQGNQGGLSSNNKDSDLIVFWEYHDLVQNTIDWVAENGTTSAWAVLKPTSENPYPFEGSCFIPIVLTKDDDDLIGITDIQPIEDQVSALNRMRVREVYHMDNFGTGIICEEGAIDPSQLKNYLKTPYGFVLYVKQEKMGKMQTVSTPALGQDHYSMANVHKEEIQTTLGITDYQKGAGGGVTATEAQIITSAATSRVDAKRGIVADFVIEIIRKLAALIQKFDTETQFYNVANEEFDDDFVEVLKKEYGFNPKIPFLGISNERIQGEYDFDFNVEDMINQPKEVRAAQLSRSLQAIASNELLMKKFIEKHDADKVIDELFELNGVDVKKFEKGGPVQIPAVVEDHMFTMGMEVPEPHSKDDDDEHLISHNKTLQQLMTQVGPLQQKIQQLQAGLQMAPQMEGGDPGRMQLIQQKTQEQIDQLMMQIQPIQNQIRNIKLHMQAHDQQALRKKNDDGMAGMGAGNQMGPQTGRPAQPPSQVQMNMPAQVPQG